MKPNVGPNDGAARVWAVLFISIALLAGFVPANLTWVALAVMGILVLTGITGICPLYKILGFNTFKEERHLDY